jgi:hypothetical protein
MRVGRGQSDMPLSIQRITSDLLIVLSVELTMVDINRSHR